MYPLPVARIMPRLTVFFDNRGGLPVFEGFLDTLGGFCFAFFRPERGLKILQ